MRFATIWTLARDWWNRVINEHEDLQEIRKKMERWYG